MSTMLQGLELSLEADFLGREGCNEILNATHADVFEDIHDACCRGGHRPGRNQHPWRELVQPLDYGIDDRIEARRKGAEIARDAPKRQKKTEGRMRCVLGSMGPDQAPSLGYTSYDYT
ncbi:homocysteine S-methyltransferase family protein [Arthrobacter sp. R4-81]